MITKEIYQIGGSGFTAPEDAAAYLIYVDGRAAIVDAGCGNATGAGCWKIFVGVTYPMQSLITC